MRERERERYNVMASWESNEITWERGWIIIIVRLIR